jgi:hypothetical protein
MFSSYDTEALNSTLSKNMDEQLEFENVFNDTAHPKLNFGVQKLYLIGNI